ncbi:MAG: Ig-like domain-containing protein [Burkholderiaceae bacterium]|jgi:hypothetical protein|nr:Ig-like domain-containing protein [Burkholderiaceae bacterium]
MNVSKNGYKRTLNVALAMAASFSMLACGDDAPGPAPVTPGGTTTLAALEVTVATPNLEARANQSTQVTITAVDANRRALADIPVSLSASSGIINSTSTSTDSSGRLTATFGLGSDRGNRDVAIRAASGTIVGQAAVAVTGTTVSMTASPPTAQSATTQVEIAASVVDAAKVPLSGVVVSFVTTAGTLSSAVATTDATGVAKVTLTGVTSTATVTGTGANANAVAEVKAGSTALPAPEPAGVTIRDLSVQVNPSVIGPNAGTSEANFSQLDVRVTGDVGTAVGVPVRNAPVRFRIASTPAFGRLSVDTSAAPVLSNAGGLVSARFIAGAATSGTDQIVICASVDGVAALPPPASAAPCSANERAARLTISQQPLFVRISTNNEIAKVNNNLDYEKLFSIYVTNAAGQGVPGASVSVRLLPQFYFKGSMNFVMGSGWTFAAPPVQCVNEDTNFNGVLDSGDNNQNMDALLWPGQSAAFTLDNNGVTDSSGFVVLRVRHGQRFAFWAQYQISAGASTAGSDPPTTFNYTLSAAKADVDAASTPGFAVSPFGVAAVCTNPN